jgi:hypothetical protein
LTGAAAKEPANGITHRRSTLVKFYLSHDQRQDLFSAENTTSYLYNCSTVFCLFGDDGGCEPCTTDWRSSLI